MLEVKVNVVVTAPELASAINNLAVAISSKAAQHVSDSTSAPAPAPMPFVPTGSTTPAPVAPVQPAPVVSAPVVPATPVQQSATPIAGVPLASAPQFTVDQIMAAGATLMDAGKVEDLMNLLHSFGVQAVMELKPEQLGAFATEMRKLGAAI